MGDNLIISLTGFLWHVQITRAQTALYPDHILHLIVTPEKAGFPNKYFSIFLHGNICCGYSLKVPWLGASNEYH